MLALPVSCCLGLLLLLTAWSKYREPRKFLEIVQDYPWLRSTMPRRWVWMVPWLEALLGVALLSLNPWLTTAALVGVLLWILLASIAVAARLVRGERRFRCGCGGNLDEEHSAAGVLQRNGLLSILVGGVLAIGHPGWPVDTAVLPVYLTAVGGVLGVGLAGAALRAWRNTGQWKVSG